MFRLKWFNTPLIGKTEKLTVNDQPEGPIMDMPDLVMRKIMENVDFITMLKLRKVCHAFRDFIDVIKLDNELTKVNIDVTPSAIYAFLDFASKPMEPVKLCYIRYGNNCLFKIQEGKMEEAKLIKNQDLVDAFFNNFGFVLRNRSKPLKYMKVEEWPYGWYRNDHYDIVVINSHRASSSIYECCTSTADQFHDRFDCILKSRKSLTLDMRILKYGTSNFRD
ncbi:hypothetical protein GCK72_011223 [Caenorhabditis remanei]|uniref:F-box domain-containing protein n=1 Tax=Caenorhabditis remanei TaxID=31234 RepID=A0A6A5H5E4_CAERE|nr:hypothetical protein GCK72_011223 [Caenorhabditis remanei]KAF1762958.1 hypothetical protein GCK72_011223 [Caenorhabditis remanei]